MARKVITVDGRTYKSKAAAMNEYLNAMLACEGSEAERMTFAYCAICNGYTNINTYKETAC